MLEVAQHAQTGYLTESHPYSESLWFQAVGAATVFEQDWRFLNQVAAAIGIIQVLLAGLLWRWTRSTPLVVTTAWTLAASLWPTGAWLTALPRYASIQFCWRWQPLLAVVCAITAASLPWRKALCVAPLALFLALGRPSSQPPGIHPDLASNLIEMRPLGASHERFPPGKPGLVEVVAGDCVVQPLQVRPSLRRYAVEARTGCEIRVLTYHFRGWEASIDGKAVAVGREPGTALQLLTVPPGRRVVEMRYAP
jgi:hypothetical protein